MGSSFASALQARQQAMVLPEDPPWWELFNATKDEITVVSKTILTLYAYVGSYFLRVVGCMLRAACCTLYACSASQVTLVGVRCAHLNNCLLTALCKSALGQPL